MIAMKKFVACFLFLLLIGTGLTLKCYKYHCSGDCWSLDEPYHEKLRVKEECTGATDLCAVSLPVKIHGPIYRGCTSDKNFCDTNHPPMYKCYTCNEDLCNSV
ncbi:hypothetical protein PPYR_12524 [Photinus pyralis]|uniref:Protein sleepless n=1 Tax=Photinus pyralis TaxID=7054 RepID=A0A1Y1LMJ5_PHOPY|nr:uncharacterized protein LOC116177762 [Photinus pyralis]KAB0792904.1 hypothetical protein PPYR_12524 [Photinus pyralis]